MAFIPNTTPTPNWLYNGEMKKMNETELKVVLYITRKTLGWIDNSGQRKDRDWISQKQFMEKTGMSNRAISTAIETCLIHGWIEAYDRTGKELNTAEKRSGNRVYYRLGNMFRKKISCEVNSQDNKPVKLTTQTCEVDDIKPVKNVHSTKETLTKETNTNDCETIVSHLKQSLKSEEKKNFTDQPFSFKQSLEGMQASEQRHLQIIALYWQFKNIIAENKDQYATLLGKELKAARDLKGFSDKQITEIMEYLEHNETFKWNLQSVLKYVGEDLSRITAIKNKKYEG